MHIAYDYFIETFGCPGLHMLSDLTVDNMTYIVIAAHRYPVKLW